MFNQRTKPDINPGDQRYPQAGDRVLVAEKINYESGELTEGIVKDVLTKKRFHPRGHKVRLTSGIIGRVQKFLNENSTISQKIKVVEIDNDPLALS